MKLIRDLFMGVSNSAWDLGRVMAGGSFASYTGGLLYALAKGHFPDWAALGTGYAALLAGAGALIGIKDVARATAASKTTITVDGGAQ